MEDVLCRIETDFIALNSDNQPIQKYPNSLFFELDNQENLNIHNKSITYTKTVGSKIIIEYYFSYKQQGNFTLKVYATENLKVMKRYLKFEKSLMIIDGWYP